MPYKCCVLGCKYEGKNGFHSFPSDRTVSVEWIEFAQVKNPDVLKDLLNKKKLSHSHYQLCHNHFEPTDDYLSNVNGDRRLKKGAIPSRCSPNVLLSVQREHDYSPIPRKRAKHEDVELSSIVTSSGCENIVNVDGNNNPDSFFDDFFRLVEVGANTDVPLGDWLDTPPHENKKKTGVDIGKPNEDFQIPSVDHQYKITTNEELNFLDEWTDNNVVKYLSKKFNNQQLEIFKMQIFNSGKKVNGRRYTDDQKSLALCMYKQSPKKYRFLRRFLILPGRSTLGRHRAHLAFQSGIDPKLMGLMKLKVKDMADADKLSMLCWDEVSLKPHLDYDKSRDVIDGFVDMNGLRRQEFATHALTFMVRGIQTPFKEPVAFNYTSSGLKAVELSGLVRVTAQAMLDTGLNLIGSVCDQPPTCAAAVHDLVEPGCEGVTPTGEVLSYKINDSNLIHVYDVPHVLKVLRNNLLVKDLCHTLTKRWEITDCKHSGGVKKYASWDHIIGLYNLDIHAVHRLTQLTPEHIAPDKEKMKVSNATQIFSATVGNAMLRCGDGKLPVNVSDTALVLLFFNDLFDSLNGGGAPQCESLKGSIDYQSVHFAYWEYALSALANMNFVDKTTRNINNRSSVLKKLESTIRGYMEITRICLNSNVPEVAIRNSNQDGLENFFGCCKSICGAKPIASHYRSAYATMIMNNLIGPVSKGSNCEEDRFHALLSNINKMMLEFDDKTEETDDQINLDAVQINIEEENERNMLESIVFDPLFGESQLNFVETESIRHKSSAICRKLVESAACADCLTSLQETSLHLNTDHITLPSQTFTAHFEKLFSSVTVAIPHFCHEKSVRKKISTQIQSIQDHPIGCAIHCEEMAMKLKELTLDHALSAFTNTINNTLSGKIKELIPGCDHIQQMAFEFRKKKLQIGKHSDKFIK